jgi:hypothetical protein
VQLEKEMAQLAGLEFVKCIQYRSISKVIEMGLNALWNDRVLPAEEMENRVPNLVQHSSPGSSESRSAAF